MPSGPGLGLLEVEDLEVEDLVLEDITVPGVVLPKHFCSPEKGKKGLEI